MEIKIVQLDLNDNVIAQYDSITKASISTKTNKSKISSVISGTRKTAGSYKWARTIIEDPEEVWKELEEYPDYKFSNLGNILSYKSNSLQLVKGTLKDGYLIVRIMNRNGETENVPIHRAIAKAFCKRDDLSKDIVNHLDNNVNGINNKSDNLEWVNSKENTQHYMDNFFPDVNIFEIDLLTEEIIQAFKNTKELAEFYEVSEKAARRWARHGFKKDNRGNILKRFKRDSNNPHYDRIHGTKIKNEPEELISDWRDIIIEDKLSGYKINSVGQVKNKQNKLLNPYVNKNGYYVVSVNSRTHLVHRLVAQTFLDNPLNLPVVHHIDSDRKNNDVDNLSYVTYQENTEHSYESGNLKNLLKKVSQYDCEGHFLKEFDSVKSTKIHSLYGRDKEEGDIIFSKGYIWMIGSNMPESIEITNELQKCIDRYNIKRQTILQLDIEGVVEIARYSSIEAAAKSINKTPGNIYSVLTGKSLSAGGYKWRRVEED